VGKSEEAKGRGGLLYGLAAHGMWGLMPLYIWAMDRVPPHEILANRIVWCGVFLLVVVILFQRWSDLGRCLRTFRTLGLLTLSSLLIAANWFCYIYAANNNETIQASLGYFINPLFSVLLGMVVFGERLRPAQWLAVLLATAGAVVLVVAGRDFPWIALALAVSFAFYGLVRKLAPVDAVIGLTVETLLLVPGATAFLLFWAMAGQGSFGHSGPLFDALLLGTGIVTAVPLLCFGQAARRLSLTTLGLLQYIAPTLQFLLAVWVRGEPFLPSKAVSFALIWAALLIFSVDSLLKARRLDVVVGR
jgi:chloramphenicol-sensitive protein RarD